MLKYGAVILIGLFPLLLAAQPSRQPMLQGRFLTDSIEIGQPFYYSLTFRHAAMVDVLFPDTARHFAPYRVKQVAIFPTYTTGKGPEAISRDSAVYTLVSFEIDSMQFLRVPVRVLHETDCTAQWTQLDTVFLRSQLPKSVALATGTRALTLATETQLATLQQQFNYAALAKGALSVGIAGLILYWLFGQAIRKQWGLFVLYRQHLRFQNEYNRLNRNLNAYTASETANRAVVMWKSYLETLDKQPYTSLTTPELAERMNDERVTDALREADRMIYGGAFSPLSQQALLVLGEVASQAYNRSRHQLVQQSAQSAPAADQSHSSETSSLP